MVGNELAPSAQDSLGLSRESWHLGPTIPWNNSIKRPTNPTCCLTCRHSKILLPEWMKYIISCENILQTSGALKWVQALNQVTYPINGKGKGGAWRKAPKLGTSFGRQQAGVSRWPLPWVPASPAAAPGHLWSGGSGLWCYLIFGFASKTFWEKTGF